MTGDELTPLQRDEAQRQANLDTITGQAHPAWEHLPTYMTMIEFYADRPERERSMESDYGVHWHAPGVDWPKWRVSYIQATGEVYAVCQLAGQQGPVRVYGVVPADDPATDPRLARGYVRGRWTRTLDGILEGWAETDDFCLDWVVRTLRAAGIPAPDPAELAWRRAAAAHLRDAHGYGTLDVDSPVSAHVLRRIRVSAGCTCPIPAAGDAQPEEQASGVVRDTDGTIMRGLSLPCGCPLDSGCTGQHPGRLG